MEEISGHSKRRRQATTRRHPSRQRLSLRPHPTLTGIAPAPGGGSEISLFSGGGTPHLHNNPGYSQQQVDLTRMGSAVQQEILNVCLGTGGGGVDSGSSLREEPQQVGEDEPSLPLQQLRVDGGAAGAGWQGRLNGWRRVRGRRVVGGHRMWAAVERLRAAVRTHAGASRARAESAARRMDRMQVWKNLARWGGKNALETGSAQEICVLQNNMEKVKYQKHSCWQE